VCDPVPEKKLDFDEAGALTEVFKMSFGIGFKSNMEQSLMQMLFPPCIFDGVVTRHTTLRQCKRLLHFV